MCLNVGELCALCITQTGEARAGHEQKSAAYDGNRGNRFGLSRDGARQRDSTQPSDSVHHIENALSAPKIKEGATGETVTGNHS